MLSNSLTDKAHLNNIWKLGSYLKGNTSHCLYICILMNFRRTFVLYYENQISLYAYLNYESDMHIYKRKSTWYT